MKLTKLITTAMLVASVFPAYAKTDQKVDEAITKNLAKYDIEVNEIQTTPIEGVFEVVTKSGILYTNKDASYFLYGKLYQANDNNLIDLTAKTEGKRNLVLLAEAKVEDEYINYPAKDEKYVVTIFTDTTCGYCRKLHNEMKGYNDLGITIRYLAFPRAGMNASNVGQMSAIWCAKDKQEAMNKAKGGIYDENSAMCRNIVAKHYKLGQDIGITGTPAILAPDGSLISGYLPPAALLQRLKG